MKIRHTDSTPGSARERLILIVLHSWVILAIAMQWISAEFMAEPWSDEGSSWGRLLFSVHYWSGITTITAFFALLVVLWRRHPNIRAHFFPWSLPAGRQQLWREARCIGELFPQRHIPPPEQTQTLAGGVQGLGLLALSGFVFSGIGMALLGPETEIAHEIGEIHELFWGPLIAYVVVHGGAGVLHHRAGHPMFSRH